MKVMSEIPKEIIRKYCINRTGRYLYIHKPFFICIHLDDSFKVVIRENVVMIETMSCSIDLSKVTFRTHTTIF